MGKADQPKEDMGITKLLAEFVCGLDFQEIPPDVVRLSMDSIMDGIGVSIFGSTHANSKKIKSYVKTVGGVPHASVIGDGFKTSSPMAALANGYMARCGRTQQQRFYLLFWHWERC